MDNCNRVNSHFFKGYNKHNYCSPLLSAIPEYANVPCGNKKGLLFRRGVNIRQTGLTANQQAAAGVEDSSANKPLNYFLLAGNVLLFVLNVLMSVLKTRKGFLQQNTKVLDLLNNNLTKVNHRTSYMQQYLDYMWFAAVTKPTGSKKLDARPLDVLKCGSDSGPCRENVESLLRGIISSDAGIRLISSTCNDVKCLITDKSYDHSYLKLQSKHIWLQRMQADTSAAKDRNSSAISAEIDEQTTINRELGKMLGTIKEARQSLSRFGR